MSTSEGQNNTMSETNDIDLTILGMKEVEEEMNKGVKWDVIVSILCPPADTMETQKNATFRARLQKSCTSKNILCMDFDDVDSVCGTDTTPPTESHVLLIKTLAMGSYVEHWSKHDGTKLRVLMHCAAGISRSTAAALIYLHEVGYTKKDAIEIMRKVRVRPTPDPNVLMLQLADNAWMQQQI